MHYPLVCPLTRRAPFYILRVGRGLGISKHSGASVSRGADVDPLELATTRFRYIICCSPNVRGTVWWPDALDHPCMRVSLAWSSSPAKGDDEYGASTARI